MRLMQAFGIVVVLLASAVHASAMEKCADAESIFKKGESQYNLGKYQDAIDIWEALYVDCPSPGLLFNMAQAHRTVGNADEAITLYRSYLRESPNIDPKLRKDVEERIADLAAQIAAKRKVAESPPKGVATSDGNLESDPLTGTPASTAELESRDPPALRNNPPRWYEDKLAWTVAAVGVVGVGVGTGFLLAASSADGDADAAATEQDFADALDLADSRRTIGTVTLLGGAAVLTAGVVLLMWSPSPERAPSSTEARVSLGLGWVGVVGSF